MPQPTLLNKGDIVLVPFPFADLSGQKLRPAIIVSANPQGNELIIAFITSVLGNRSPRGAEIELRQSDSEFALTGLKTDSLIRLDKVVTLTRNLVSRRLGHAGPATSARIVTMLRRALDL